MSRAASVAALILGFLAGYIVADDARIERVAEAKAMADPVAADRHDEIRQAMEQMGQQIQGARK